MGRGFICFLVGYFLAASADGQNAQKPSSFVNWETPPIHPIALSPDGATLAVCNLPDNRVELFAVAAVKLVAFGNVAVGLDPVSVHFRSNDELWVVNHVSDSISIVAVHAQRVVATLTTLNEPSDVIFAGSPLHAFVTCSEPGKVQVFDPSTHALIGVIPIFGEEPKSMAASPDGKRVYVAIFESGNASTILAPGLTQLDHMGLNSVADYPDGPHKGVNPPPNSGAEFSPRISPGIPATNQPPRVGLIVKRDNQGRWMDDNQGDWTEFVSGDKAYLSGRTHGWNPPDNDVAVIDANNLSVSYVTGLMNICMDVAVNPVSEQISVVGTDGLNQIRFEPVLNGVFLRVNLASVDPRTSRKSIKDLNPHLDYRSPIVPETMRVRSIGDPRGIVWNSTGTRAYVTGMGSNNLLVLDAEGNRMGPPLKLGEGPTGLALDEIKRRLYVLNRFEASVSVIDTERNEVIDTLRFFDPTPKAIKAGRKHFYNTHKSSGLGLTACASCHVDGRGDRLAWDLGNPTGTIKKIDPAIHNLSRFTATTTNHFHPMKGPMVTQTLQDIIGHEPFHWRGDRNGLEQFNPTFPDLQGAPVELTRREMQEFEDFLGTIAFPPNPFREFNNALSTNVVLEDHLRLGRGARPAGSPLPNGNAQAGLTVFLGLDAKGCIVCHTLPSGLGPDKKFSGGRWSDFPIGPNREQHVSLSALNRARQLPFKIPHLRDLYKKTGASFSQLNGPSGFGFLHDGRVESLVRFLQDGFDFRTDEETANMIAFLVSLTGSDLPPGSVTDQLRAPGAPSLDVAAAVGKQLTLASPTASPMLDQMVALARNRTSRVDLVVKGPKDGIARGWFYDSSVNQFVSDRDGEWDSVDSVRSLAKAGNELTFTIVPHGSGRRIGIDGDEDAFLDRTEMDAGADPANPRFVPGNHAPVIDAIADVTTTVERSLALRVRATDQDSPTAPLRFVLETGFPPGAGIDAQSGNLEWTPSRGQGPGTYVLTVKATDGGNPPLSDSVTFTVRILDPAFALSVTRDGAGGGVELSWEPTAGKTYQIQFKNDLHDLAWKNLTGELKGAGLQMGVRDAIVDPRKARYYRLLLVE